MSLAPRHLQPRRPRKDRDVTWSRRFDLPTMTVFWIFWRRDLHRVVHSKTLSASERDPLGLTCMRLLDAKRELRDFVDEIDLAAMEETA